MDFTRLKRLYSQGRIGRKQLEKAISLGWLTREQAQVIEDGGIDPAPEGAEVAGLREYYRKTQAILPGKEEG